jgi:hypothetical protein
MNKTTQLSEQLRKLHEELAALRNGVERPSMPREDSTVNILAAQLKHVTEDVETLRRALTPEHSRSFQDTTDALIKALELDVRLKELVNQKESSRDPATANAAVSQPPLHAFSPLVRWSTLGFALVGAATGLFAGMSQSPVVAALLPMLFALLGGTGGIFIAKTDLLDAHVAGNAHANPVEYGRNQHHPDGGLRRWLPFMPACQWPRRCGVRPFP